MIWFNGFPFLDNKEEHSFGVSVSAAMTSFVMTLPAVGATLIDLERVLASSPYQGFPIVETDTTRDHSNILVGYIGRTELRYVLDRAQADASISSDATCSFSQPETAPASATTTTVPMTPVTPAIRIAYDLLTQEPTVDISRFVDFTPLAVHPRLPLETAMELFKKMGPRVILVEHHGRLMGLVTVKDCLKYQFKAEAGHEASPRDNGYAVQQERLWSIMQRVAVWVAGRVERWSGGRVKLGEAGEGQSMRLATPLTGRRGGQLAENGSIAVELDDRSAGAPSSDGGHS